MIPFAPPYIDDEIVEEVSKVLRSGWITTGPRTKAFEEELAAYCGASQVLCVSSGTAAMELILFAFGIKEGDEVIVPSYTYCATAHVVKKFGAIPVMVDIMEDEASMDPEGMLEAVTERTKAVIPVDVGGWPAPQERIMDRMASDRTLQLFTPETPLQESLGRPLVISDAAHSLGACLASGKVGSVSDVTAFSFHAVKNLTTAEGGALAIRFPRGGPDPETLYSRLNTISLHGQTKDALNKFQRGGWRYDVKELGLKCNMTDIQAAIGSVQLKKYEELLLARRKWIFHRYNEAFEDLEEVRTPVMKDEGRTGAYHLYMLRFPVWSKERRDEMIRHLMEAGVSANVHFIPLPMLSYYRELGYSIDDHPNAFAFYRSELSLPLFYDLSDEQVEQVIAEVRRGVMQSEDP
ncbi:MAG: DegT/DnrJ/EryC1/StrS family aminotransferase [Flavobacteriales bacterium]